MLLIVIASVYSIINVDNLISKFENYQEFKLTDIADCQNGKAFYKDGYDDNGAMVIDLGNVNTSATFVKTNSDKYISMSRYNDPKLSKYRVLKDDLVMVMTDRKSTMDLLGKTGKIYQEGLYLLNQRMYRIRAKNNINVNYLYAVLNSSETSAALKEKALGSVQKYVNTGDINELLIKIPSISEMNEIASIIDPIMQMIEIETRYNGDFEAYLKKEVERELRKNSKAYLSGWIRKVSEKVNEFALSDEESHLIDLYIDKNHPDMTTMRTGRRAAYTEDQRKAYSNGVRDAEKNVQLYHGINGQASERLGFFKD